MIKRWVMVSVVCSLLLAIVAGCGAGGGKVKESSESTEIYKMSNDPVELTVTSTSGDSEASFNDRFGNMIRKKYPNLTLKYIQSKKDFGIKDMLVSGLQIDIYFDSIGFFAGGLLDNELQLDMNPLIKKHNINLGSMETSIVDAMKQLSGEKAMYGVPVFNNNVVMYYNKDIFDKFGVPYPKDGMNWEELSDLAKKVSRSDGDRLYAGYATSGTHVFRMNQLSLPYVDPTTGKASINSEKWKKFIETVFINPYKASGEAEFTAKYNKGLYTAEFFTTRELAMFVLLSSSMFIQKEFETMNWDMVALPTFKDLPGVGSQAYPTYFSVTSISKHKEEATEIIKYLVSVEAQTELSKKGVMPSLTNDAIKKVFGQESRFKDKNMQAVFYNKFAPIPPKTKYDAKLESPYVKSVGIAETTSDINTALRDAEEKANKLLEDAKK